MSSDFWAGYISGALGIIIGNPLDLIKVRLQARSNGSLDGVSPIISFRGQFDSVSSLVRGAAAPVLGYGALNALLFVAYNRSLKVLEPSLVDPTCPDHVALSKIWLAGAAGGLASWVISSPTELVKCRAQLSRERSVSSWVVAKDIVKQSGLRSLYFGGLVTSIRDSVGYGFYFWSYELCKRSMAFPDESNQQEALKILLCGGIAGVVTWASVFPLDVIKTRLQAQPLINETTRPLESQALLGQIDSRQRVKSAVEIAKDAYRTEGVKAFYRGLGICSVRAFIVNAVQWATYEWLMKTFNGVLVEQPSSV